MLPEDGTEWALLVLGPSKDCSSPAGAWLLLDVYRTGFILEQTQDRHFHQGFTVV